MNLNRKYDLRKNVATNKKYILGKIHFKFQNPKYDILCKIASSVMFLLLLKQGNPLESIGQRGHSESS